MECNFSDEIMTKVDKKGESWEGSGWVSIFKETGIIHCYTIECNYHNGKWLNRIPPQINCLTKSELKDTGLTDIGDRIYYNGIPPPFTIDILEDAGWATAVALLDII